MGTEVLRPHDCLTERIRLPPASVYPRRRSSYNNNIHPAKAIRSKPAQARSDLKKKSTELSPSAAISRRYSSDDLKQSKQKHNQPQQLVIGQITILKRGEPLDLKPPTGNDLIVSGTERIGPDPVTVTKQVRIKDPKMEGRSRSLSPKAVYAGSAFSVSPSPESLPLPSFSKKKKEVFMSVDDSATRDLRRLLRLD